jgi:hypothetical protein
MTQAGDSRPANAGAGWLKVLSFAMIGRLVAIAAEKGQEKLDHNYSDGDHSGMFVRADRLSAC